MTKPGADRRPDCEWRDETGRRCVGGAAWGLRCVPRRADSRRGSWPGDIDLVRVCPHHLEVVVRERRVLGPPTPLGEPA